VTASSIAIKTQALPAAAGRSLYRPELDAMRFFAFLGVFLFHFSRPVDLYVEHGVPRVVATGINALMQAGVYGVDLFFVLSAYLITVLLLREKETTGRLDIKSFYLRRILRIWPLYFFFIGVALVPALDPAGEFTSRYVVAFLLLAGNWSIVAWGWPGHSIVNPLWTVSIEEQFYLLWPPVVRKVSRESLVWVAVAMLVFASLARIALVALQGGPNSVWCNTLTRLDPIALGILAAALLRGRLPSLGWIARVGMLTSGIVALALVANFWKIHGPETLEWIPTLVGFPVVAVSCLAILLSVLGISAPMPSSLVYLGKISYGLYVYHALGNLLSLRLIPVRADFLQLALRPLAAFAITVALAALSYALLEKPFLRLKDRFAHVQSRPI